MMGESGVHGGRFLTTAPGRPARPPPWGLRPALVPGRMGRFSARGPGAEITVEKPGRTLAISLDLGSRTMYNVICNVKICLYYFEFTDVVFE